MVDIKLIFLALGLFISLSVAYYSLKVFDKTKANISTKKIIDSTQEKTPFSEKLAVQLSRLSFNKEETKNNLVRAGIHSDFIAQYLLPAEDYTAVILFSIYWLFLHARRHGVFICVYFILSLDACVFDCARYVHLFERECECSSRE